MRGNARRLILGLAGAGAVVLGAALAATSLYRRYVPPAAGEAAPAEEENFAAAAARFSGTIVWSSNRSGSHEIHRLDLRGGKARLRALTDSPYVDTFPRFSPDGRKILFNRSREHWVSFRDPDRWDVWIMESDGRGQRRVAEHGYHASFAPDGRAIVFDRRGTVVRTELDGGRETVLVDVGKELGGRAQEPELFGGGLALTVRGRGRRAFGVYDLERRRFREMRGDSCQINWWPGGERLVWVEAEGNGGNRIVWGTPAKATTLIDLPGSRSHEYFPRASRDGRWLVWGATTTGHEHDRADYEIFLWKVGDPPASAIRITRHTGNDQWPEVWAR
ncbi:MAG: TolB family protein [Candidatus Binatia bacterium]